MPKIMIKHFKQQDHSDCGVLCLKILSNVFGKDTSIEHLKIVSGTSLTGTTMLGLMQGARSIGLHAEGYDATLQDLKDCKDPCILHVIKYQRLHHFIVVHYWDLKKSKFLVSDPAEDTISYLSEAELDEIWKSKKLLLIKKGEERKEGIDSTLNQWTWFRSLLDPDLQPLLITGVIGVFTTILGLSTALFSQKLIDEILPAKDNSRLILGILLLLALLVIKGLFSRWRGWFLLRQSKLFNLRLITFFFSKLLQLPKTFFDSRKTGDMVARLNDTQRIQRVLASVINSVMIDGVMVMVSLMALIVMNGWLGLISLLWIPIFYFIVRRYNTPLIRKQREVMAAYGLNESQYIDTIQGIDTIKVNNRQSIFGQITNHLYSNYQETNYQLGLLGIRLGFWTELVTVLFIVSFLGFGSYQVMQGNLTTGSMIAMLQMTTSLVMSVSHIALINIQIQEAKIAFDRMYEFTSIANDSDQEANSPKSTTHEIQEIRAEHLSFRFIGRPLLLQNISFKAAKGEMIALLGEMGSGKSTLLQIIQKFYKHESGTLKVNGLDLDYISIDHWRSKIGVVPQQIKLFNGTLLDNLLLGESFADPLIIEQKLKDLGVHDYFLNFPNGYATLLGENGIQISGGQQQMVALTRALLKKPELLILDEPTASMDKMNEKLVFDILHRLKNDMITILVTHRLHTAKKCERIYIIENGKTTNYGNHDQLMESENLYSFTWNDLLKRA